MATPPSRRVKILAIEPPFAASDGVLFGMQAKREVDDPVPAVETTDFDIDVEAKAVEPAGHDFRGPWVHGRKGDRFLYLSWGLPGPADPFVMFARAKLKLADIPPELIDGSRAGDDIIVCEVQATNEKGHPASGTIRPPRVRWSGQSIEMESKP